MKPNASHWAGTRDIGACMSMVPATGNGLGARGMCISLRRRAREELAIGGTRAVPTSCQRDHGAWGSLGTRPAGMCVSNSESTGELAIGYLRSPSQLLLYGGCVCVFF